MSEYRYHVYNENTNNGAAYDRKQVLVTEQRIVSYGLFEGRLYRELWNPGGGQDGAVVDCGEFEVKGKIVDE